VRGSRERSSRSTTGAGATDTDTDRSKSKKCPNLDDDDRADIDAWRERAQQDFAAGKKANPEPNAQHAIAAACRKAVASVTAASERCKAGPKPVGDPR
jgi:hypothetical protein